MIFIVHFIYTNCLFAFATMRICKFIFKLYIFSVTSTPHISVIDIFRIRTISFWAILPFTFRTLALFIFWHYCYLLLLIVLITADNELILKSASNIGYFLSRDRLISSNASQ